MEKLNKAVQLNIEQIIQLLQQLNEGLYTQPITSLSNASIGAHVRHIIELYLELQNGYQSGLVNYDNRKRDYTIETNMDFAIQQLHNIINNLQPNNKNLLLQSCFVADESIETETNYYRELAYNIEHTVHHQALIKVGLLEISTVPIANEFGVAAATLKYRNVCVQ